jgi:beta-phosphoglucomutase family hydrolase
MNFNKNETAAIIFDMDGVLINSEPLHIKTWKQAMEPYDVNMKEEWYKQWIGTSDETVARYFCDHYHIDLSWKQLLDKKRCLYLEVFDQYIKESSQMRAIISEINNYKLGVASSSSRKEVHFVLQKLNILPFFKVIVGGDDVKNSKPAPDIYLLAAKKMGVKPEKCVALEDSSYGIQSAKSAGMFVIGITSSFTEEKLNQADLIFHSTAEAIQWLCKSLNIK